MIAVVQRPTIPEASGEGGGSVEGGQGDSGGCADSYFRCNRGIGSVLIGGVLRRIRESC